MFFMLDGLGKARQAEFVCRLDSFDLPNWQVCEPAAMARSGRRFVQVRRRLPLCKVSPRLEERGLGGRSHQFKIGRPSSSPA